MPAFSSSYLPPPQIHWFYKSSLAFQFQPKHHSQTSTVKIHLRYCAAAQCSIPRMERMLKMLPPAGFHCLWLLKKLLVLVISALTPSFKVVFVFIENTGRLFLILAQKSGRKRVKPKLSTAKICTLITKMISGNLPLNSRSKCYFPIVSFSNKTQQREVREVG